MAVLIPMARPPVAMSASAPSAKPDPEHNHGSRCSRSRSSPYLPDLLPPRAHEIPDTTPARLPARAVHRMRPAHHAQLHRAGGRDHRAVRGVSCAHALLAPWPCMQKGFELQNAVRRTACLWAAPKTRAPFPAVQPPAPECARRRFNQNLAKYSNAAHGTGPPAAGRTTMSASTGSAWKSNADGKSARMALSLSMDVRTPAKAYTPITR